MRDIQNDCVGCPQGCISCGRNHNYTVFYCDRCNDELEENEVYELDGKEYCEQCYYMETTTEEDALIFANDILGDMLREKEFENAAVLIKLMEMAGKNNG